MKKWKIEELVYFARKPIETSIEELGWFLISNSGEKRLWWKDGYLLYYGIGNDTVYDWKRKIITEYISIGHIDYSKVDYHRFLVVKLEDYSVRLDDSVKIASTEIIAFPILKIHNDIVDKIMDVMQEMERDAEQREQST